MDGMYNKKISGWCAGCGIKVDMLYGMVSYGIVGTYLYLHHNSHFSDPLLPKILNFGQTGATILIPAHTHKLRGWFLTKNLPYQKRALDLAPSINSE